MRVLLNTKPFALTNKTGVGYYVFNLYSELLKSGTDVAPTLDIKSKLLIGSLSNVSAFLRDILGEGYAAAARRIGDAFVSRISRDDSGFDVYHETSLDPMPEMGVRSVCTVYDLSFFSCPAFLPEDFAKRVGAVIARNVAIADRVIVISEFVRGEIMRFLGIPGGKIDVIPLAASAAYSGKSADILRRKRSRHTIKDFILYVGTVEPRKNLKILIRAFKEIKLKYDLSLIIAGGLGWRHDEILSYPEQLGIRDDVIFTGYIDRETLIDLYHNALAFVYPSLYEGFGLPPLEAMACGVPAIVSKIEPLVEVAGDAALFFFPNDHEELADKICMLLSSETLRQQQREKGLARASEYSWEKVAALTVHSYSKALNR